MRRSVTAQAASLCIVGAALAACSGQSGADAYATKSAETITVQASRRAAAMDMVAEPAPPPPGDPGNVANAGVMLAYSYSIGLSAPKTAIPAMVAGHEKQCIDAGPAVCQVLGSSVNSYGEDQVSAYLNIRAEPKWLSKFRRDVATDAAGAGGKITADTVSTEDLTQFILDTDARLEAKKSLRDRIRQLLDSREGTLNDVLAAERAFAEVQGEIDSMTASLGAAKARVAMSALTVSYESDPEKSSSMFKPLLQAFGDFGRTSMASLAATVNFIARSWPFFILGLIVLWILRRWWRGRRQHRA